MLLLVMLQHVVAAGKGAGALRAVCVLLWDVVFLGVRLVCDPVVSLHVPELGRAVVAAPVGQAALGQLVLSSHVFCQFALILSHVVTTWPGASVRISCRRSLLLKVVIIRRASLVGASVIARSVGPSRRRG